MRYYKNFFHQDILIASRLIHRISKYWKHYYYYEVSWRNFFL